jgi:hypothetical protein
VRHLAILLVLAGPAYELPKDPKAPVLTIDYRGGFGPARQSNDPYLAILADGTIVAEHVKAGTKLAAAELQDLLKFAIDTHKLMEFDRKAVEAQCRGGAYITDQSDTIITIAIKGRRKTVKYNASTWAAQQWPKVKELQALEAVRKRLHRVWCVALLGDAESKRLLDLANRELNKRHPKAAALTPDDLHRVYLPKAAPHRVHIARWGASGSVGAWITLPATVEIYVQPR